jgi:hypothetical protein
MVLLSELHYHPPIRYFQLASQAERLVLEQHEHYLKQTYRNRCRILTSQGPLALTVPVVKGNRKTRITQLEIDYRQRWPDTHWRTIRSAYGGSPYFAYYADLLQEIYIVRPKYLFDLNLRFLMLYLKLLGLGQPVSLTEEYSANYDLPVVDLRNLLHPKTIADNLDVKPYRQVFGKQFVPGLSILDLLFSQGPEAQTYVRDSSPAN